MIYSAKFDKEHKEAWDKYIEYAKVVDVNIEQRIDAQIATLKRRSNSVQAVEEKQMIALPQETLPSTAYYIPNTAPNYFFKIHFWTKIQC